MKKLTNLFTLIVFIFGATLLGSCDNLQTGDQSAQLADYKKKIEEYEKTIASLKERLESEQGSKPDNIITSRFAKNLYDNYTTRAEWISETVGADGDGERFMATRSLYYDLNELYNYLAYVRKQSSEAKVRPSGVRFYFGIYPEDYVRDRSKNYAKRTTFFIAPTVARKMNDKVVHLGYTLDNDFNVQLLSETIGVDQFGKARMQKGSLFNFNLFQELDEKNSLIANEMGSSPPIGK
ncbi:hypothetical protein [Aquimarina brevivitae]|uniref:Lipoprotein n=1 Tax=Aquimarina brevivitae TaxID=323412 RepID=A0A4Q7PGM9_9FLAO|nr:hypothetical protein [Aquimarina brevivitae]RZS98920.1 hypothetical protein EV197_0121 [Aquimarina brevivitae]